MTVSTPDSLLEHALDALRNGLNVLPPCEDGTKRPDSRQWSARQQNMATEAEVRLWYMGARTGIGIICGEVSGGLEMFEFEGRAVNAGMWDQFLQAAHASGLGELVTRITNGYLEQTPSNGLHALYRCPGHTASTKLARGTDGVLIETKGEGGYTIVAPSHGRVHDTGGEWRLLSGGFSTIADITPAEREALHRLARTFDETPKPVERAMHTPSSDSVGGRPGDDYNNRAQWPAILEPHGWTRMFTSRGNEHWRRPGKTEGTSATVNEDGNGVLYVFTSSTEFEPDTAYSKFAAYAILNHQGDMAAAAAELRRQGYGDDPHADAADWMLKAAAALQQKTPPAQDSHSHADRPETGPHGVQSGGDQSTAIVPLVKPFRRIPLDITQPPPPTPLLNRFLYAGCLTVLQSEPGVGKTWVATWLAMQQIEAGNHVIYIDEEGGPELITERLIALGATPAAVNQHLHYFAFEHRSWTEDDLLALDEIVALANAGGQLVLAVLDSLPDFLAAANLDEDRAKDVTTFVNVVCARFRRVGCAQLLLDHLPKPNTDRKARSRYSRGSGAKLGKADATLLLESVEEFDAGTSGRLRIWKTKDRRGKLPLPSLNREGMDIDVNVHIGNVEFVPAVDDNGQAVNRAATTRRDQIVALLSDGKPRSQRGILDDMRAAGHRGDNDTWKATLTAMVADGTIRFEVLGRSYAYTLPHHETRTEDA